jgi:ferredoxin
MSIHVDVDRDLCIGSGTCVRLAPGVFALDDEGEISVVLNPTPPTSASCGSPQRLAPPKRYGSASRRATLVADAPPTARRPDDRGSRTTRRTT